MPLDDYSDSDGSDIDQIQTSVLLGVPDGPISSASDLSKPRISRIGGLPVFPRGIPVPPLSVSKCTSCSQPMELLVQLWCPFEGSPYDRTLYIWGCSRQRCQRQSGSIKAIRALRYNEKYATKLAALRAKVAARQKPSLNQSTSNPFSMSGNGSSGTAPQLFGDGFGNVPLTKSASNEGDPDVDLSGSGDPSSASEDEVEVIDTSSVSDVTTTLGRTTLESSSPSSDNDWSSAPFYPPLYLDTVSEYIVPPSQTAPRVNNSGVGQEGWGIESYERTKGIDEVFEKFVHRVGQEPEQCIRYDLSGVPLPFSTESTYKKFFPLAHTLPLAPGTPIAATGTFSSLSLTSTTSTANDITTKRSYNPSVVSPCEACGSPRVFECQIMPNLINIFRSSSSSTRNSGKGKKPHNDEERRAELARVLGAQIPTIVSTSSEGERGTGEKGDMEWGTCWVFSCLADCCRENVGEGKVKWNEVKAGWKEEFVQVQWDV